MDSIKIKIAIWRAIIAVMFTIFTVVVVFPTIIFVLARFVVKKVFRGAIFVRELE